MTPRNVEFFRCQICGELLKRNSSNGQICEKQKCTDTQYLRSTKISISLEEYHALGGISYGK